MTEVLLFLLPVCCRAAEQGIPGVGLNIKVARGC